MTSSTKSSPQTTSSALPEAALLGGKPAVVSEPGDMFLWPIVTKEDEEAILDVLHKRAMSATSITAEFEKEYAAWMGAKYALACNTGTAALQASMFGVGLGVGDEIICPSITYWASVLQSFSLGATPVFADVDPISLCLSAQDFEKRITPHTKAVVVVHYLGHPADMDAIMAVARKHSIKVIEDVSHAHGSLYKGRKVGTFGDVAGYSLMTGKSFAIGEGGILTTNNREIYERALAFGHYERFDGSIQTEPIRRYQGLPLGGVKNRMHQMSSAMGRVQLKYYDERTAEIRRSMNYFWDLLKDTPGLRAHRINEADGSTMGGWYAPHGIYRKEELHGLSVSRFCEAVRAEGVGVCWPGCNLPLHLHPLLNEADVYGHGKPTRIANTQRDVRQPAGTLPVAEAIGKQTFGVPWFKHYRPQIIEEYALAFRKVAARASELAEDDHGDPETVGAWHFFKSSK